MIPQTLAASISLMALLSSSPAGAWSQWYYQSLSHAPFSPYWLYRNNPQTGIGPLPWLASPPWLWLHQPNLGSWWTMPGMTSGILVEQNRIPLGYGIRVHVLGGTMQNLDIGVKDGIIVIDSSNTVRTIAGSPIRMRQSGWTTRWISLPPDANLAATRMSRRDGVVEIFVPRFR